MKITLKINATHVNFDKLKSLLSNDVAIVDTEIRESIEFESKGMFSNWYVGGLFSIIDSGDLCQTDSALIVRCYSMKYWFFVVVIFLISAVFTNQYMIGIVLASIISSIIYLLIRMNAYLYFKVLVQKASSKE